jgi:hypothetical protein
VFVSECLAVLLELDTAGVLRTERRNADVSICDDWVILLPPTVVVALATSFFLFIFSATENKEKTCSDLRPTPDFPSTSDDLGPLRVKGPGCEACIMISNEEMR